MKPVSLRNHILNHFAEKKWRESLAFALALKLEALCEADTLEARLDAWIDLNKWTRSSTLREKASEQNLKSFVRLKMLLDLLAGEPVVREQVQKTVTLILDETDGVKLFADSGMPGQRGLISELWNRVIEAILPASHDVRNLENLILRQYKNPGEASRLRDTDPALFNQLVTLLVPEDRPWKSTKLSRSFADAFRLLASRVQAHGLSSDLRDRSPECSVVESPFYRFGFSSGNLAQLWYGGDELGIAASAWRNNVIECRQVLDVIKDRLDTEGVSMEIVHSLSVIDLCLKRMELMLAVIENPPGLEKSTAIKHLLVDLIRASRTDRSILFLLNTSISQLHRKIVERSGETGRHYIAQNLKEYRALWLAAAGGGLLTTLTAALKMQISHADLSLFLIGLGSGLNYAISFLFLQHLHLVLATKQPAMTAAHLADILKEKRGKDRWDEIADFATQIFSSQIAAAMGNVLMVSIGAYAFDCVWRWFLGHSYLDVRTADEVFTNLSPFDSGTLFFAAWTGVLLWLASVLGGWFGNFSVYHKIPEAIRDHSLKRLFGREKLARCSEIFERNITGWGTNISLGMLLGLVPVFGIFLGLPLDVRHVTLSTGQLAFACAALQQNWLADGWFMKAFLGIATMFVLNLSVSFLLSFFTAAKAWNLSYAEVARVLIHVVRRFCRNPWQFFRPPPG